jgi:hypothetical protein
MKTLQDVENEMLQLSVKIEVNYPELYATLNEKPYYYSNQKTSSYIY